MTTFGPLFVPEPLRDVVSDSAWLAAMLEVELALVHAEALAGIVPADAAASVAAECVTDHYDIDALSEEGRAAGNPVEPLVRALRARVGGDAARWAHFGATSQDILDSAAMLVARNAVDLILEELDGVAAASARLTEAHRDTQMAARTLLQQAVPTTFGLRAAGWLDAVLDARTGLAGVSLPAQLGGAAGTLAPLGDRGVEVLRLFAKELALAEPSMPWHTQRAPVRRLAAALGEVAAVSGKIGLDVVLLAQTEVGEVSEAAGGSSSTMPHKRNPTRAVLARACARNARAHVVALATGAHELERAAGAWHAEWGALSEALALSGGAAWAARECLDGLEVHTGRMRANMTPDLYAERDALLEHGLLRGHDDDYLGSAVAFVDHPLERYRSAR